MLDGNFLKIAKNTEYSIIISLSKKKLVNTFIYYKTITAILEIYDINPNK